jgi:hypothetical protein
MGAGDVALGMRVGAVAVEVGMGDVDFGVRAGADSVDDDFGIRVDDAAGDVAMRIDAELAGADAARMAPDVDAVGAAVGIRCGTEAVRTGADVGIRSGAACCSGFCRLTRATGFAAGTGNAGVGTRTVAAALARSTRSTPAAIGSRRRMLGICRCCAGAATALGAGAPPSSSASVQGEGTSSVESSGSWEMFSAESTTGPPSTGAAAYPCRA